MVQRRATGDRLAYFSDAVFAVIIINMVLQLKPPQYPTLAGLLTLWPTVLSYAVSYLFIAIVWVNQHHLMRLAENPPPRLIWINFAHVFMVSLVPFSTAWVAHTRLAAVPVSVYAAVFVLVNLAYLPFERHALAQATDEEISTRTRRIARVHSSLTLGAFGTATLVALKFPSWGFGLVCCALLVYLRPEPLEIGDETAGRVASKRELKPRGACRSET